VAPWELGAARCWTRGAWWGPLYCSAPLPWEAYGCPAMARACALAHVLYFSDSSSSEDCCCSYLKLVKLLASDRGPLLGLERLRAVKGEGRQGLGTGLGSGPGSGLMQSRLCRQQVKALETILQLEAALGAPEEKDAVKLHSATVLPLPVPFPRV